MRRRSIALAAGVFVLAVGSTIGNLAGIDLYNEETAIRVAFFNECFRREGIVDECQFKSAARYEAFRKARSRAERVGMIDQACPREQTPQCHDWAAGLVARLERP